MSNFSGTEHDFAAGSLFGLRGWKMDDLGRLHGVTHHEVWRPGENVASCKATVTVPCPGEPKSVDEIAKPFLGDWDSLSFTIARPCGQHPSCDGHHHRLPSSHSFDFDCECGFWAYDEAAFSPHGSVIGVIEAYGRTTVGTKGFRAEKARIVGLCRQDSSGDKLSRSVQARLSTLYPDALWCDDLDQLVSVFDGVMRAWPEMGDDFWTKPVPPVKDSYGWMLNSLNSSYLSMFGRHYSSGGIV